MAGLGPIFCPKCKADKKKEKIVSMVLSDDDVEIFCEGMRDVEGLGVDLEIEQDKKDVFTWHKSKEIDNCWIPKVEDIPPNFNWDFVPSDS
ncbi:hypothetical protein BDZ91DRAFT_804709 [Kalaharituber pfeilii]|nr:hypothetical protein BDZ91DRAFT_804709 [Kalaharituber pfeilii]